MKLGIITPIGPGHLETFEHRCLPAINAALAYSMGPFADVEVYGMDDTLGMHGRSARRNEALRLAKSDGCDWVFFLDADDLLTPNALEQFGQVLGEFPETECSWGLIVSQRGDEEAELRPHQPEVLRSWEDFISVSPLLAVQIGFFARIGIFDNVNFDESMDTGEDYKLYSYLWKNHVCSKLPVIYFVNIRGQHSTGPRSATGSQWMNVVSDMWKANTEELRAAGRDIVVEAHAPGGVTGRFAITDPADYIQRFQAQRVFFEEETLNDIREMLAERGVAEPRILEVGANIGNHVVYYANGLNAAQISPVEPNPVACARLDGNIRLNGIDQIIDRRGYGYGASDRPGHFYLNVREANNLGSVNLKETATSEGQVRVPTIALDELFPGEVFDHIKVDVEGMELAALEGMRELISRNRPTLHIEIANENRLDFVQKWFLKSGYEVRQIYQYTHSIDLLLTPA